MGTANPGRLRAALASAAVTLPEGEHDYRAVIDLIGDARFVLLGESTHGTHEFYATRAAITQRLISERGFSAVAVEADWPDAYRVNRYVRQGAREQNAPVHRARNHRSDADVDAGAGAGAGADADVGAGLDGDTGVAAEADTDANAAQALQGFRRFPSWMWRNTDVLEFIAWLHSYNRACGPARQAGFYGLDLYSMFTSIEEVLRYLDRVDPAAARKARDRYACFDHYDEDSQRYAYAAGIGMDDSCENGVVRQLLELQQKAAAYISRGHPASADAYFHAQQNARLVKNAEEYYRTMFRGRVSSWNLRDRHMADTLDALAAHLTASTGQAAKIVVWAHNSHIGDARATETSRSGEFNLGQLTRERHGSETCLIGMTTYTGWVTAASSWEGVAERKRVRPALPDSIEDSLHGVGQARFLLPLAPGSEVARALEQSQLERAIGVLYLPHTERQSHYFHAQLARQFDAVIHIDQTEAVQALERISLGPDGEVPETYPAGL